MLDAVKIYNAMEHMDAGRRARLVAALRVLRVAMSNNMPAWEAANELHVIAMRNCNLGSKTLDQCQPAADAGWAAIDLHLHQRGL